MESPKSSVPAGRYCGLSTPKHSRRLYWPEALEDYSPKLCGTQEKQEEVGWDDSPEPIRLDPKIVSSYAKKRLESLSSPVSAQSKRSKPRCPVFPFSERNTNNDLALMDDLSRRVLSSSESSSPELSALLQDDLGETLIACTQQIEHTVIVSNNSKTSTRLNVTSNEMFNEAKKIPNSSTFKPKKLLNSPPGLESMSNLVNKGSSLISAPLSSFVTSKNADNASSDSSGSASNISPISPYQEKKDREIDKLQRVRSRVESAIDKRSDQSLVQALKSFRDEADDEWLSQVCIESKKTPGKNKSPFIKSRSDNHLESPSRGPPFRRTASFNLESSSDACHHQPLKKQKSFHAETTTATTHTQCSLAEIERKRLEAKFRREYREIEKKKLEAIRRLNEKRAKTASNLLVKR